jgi:hypothetical protein
VTPHDQYVNATAMCQATGKAWFDYWRLQTSQAFVAALSDKTGIPAESLVESRTGRAGGTWVHRRIALHLASPRPAARSDLLSTF